ncbi:MAG: RNA polymerase sigma factor [Deltaproteobacteria bacterium]|nr:RNA polymerase sigma factor [Deltaproteobacteria bacterium]MBW2395372.1 RNA polymerase sigma factor [Deltaproteobacteria bacterium]
MDAAIDDLDLVRDALAGDAMAFQALHDRYRPRVLRYVQSRMRDAAEADDVTQEVFLRMHKGLDRFEGRSSFSTWILGIARNESLFRMRTLRRRRAREVVEEHDGLAEVVPLDRALHARRQLRATTRVLETLPPDRLELVMAPVLADVSVAELARRRGIKPGAVKSRQHRIRRGIRAAVAEASA